MDIMEGTRLEAFASINAWHSLAVQRGEHPHVHLRRFQERERSALHRTCLSISLRSSYEKIAATRDGSADRCATGTIRHIEIIAPGTAAHHSNSDLLARGNRHKAGADQIDIGNTIHLLVIDDAAIAIAEAALGADVELGARADAVATECAPRRPAVARKRPGNLAP